MADIILFPGGRPPNPAARQPAAQRPTPDSGGFYPIKLADGLWHIDHESAGGGSYGLTNLGPFKVRADAERVAGEMNALALAQQQQSRRFPPDDGGNAA